MNENGLMKRLGLQTFKEEKKFLTFNVLFQNTIQLFNIQKHTLEGYTYIQ